MTEQELNDPEIHSVLKTMSRKAMAERMNPDLRLDPNLLVAAPSFPDRTWAAGEVAGAGTILGPSHPCRMPSVA